MKADDIDARDKKRAIDSGDGCLTEISWVCLWVCKNKKRPERRKFIECLADWTSFELVRTDLLQMLVPTHSITKDFYVIKYL